MKLALFFALIIASVNAIAQQWPAAPAAAQPQPPKAAPMAAQPAAKFNNEELTTLLRAQTAAIKSLSSKVDSLEERIGKIEKGRR